MDNTAHRRAAARYKALSELGKRYRDEYQTLYQEALQDLPPDPEPGEAKTAWVTVNAPRKAEPPAPSSGDACRCKHDRRVHQNEIGRCKMRGCNCRDWQPSNVTEQGFLTNP